MCDSGDLRRTMKKVVPIGVEARQLALSQQRGKYLVKGPGRVVLVDGYDKLKPFGFEIYGFINGYSRYILQLYVGVDNQTAVSINKQYLRMIQKIKHLPLLIQSEKGKEIPLMTY